MEETFGFTYASPKYFERLGRTPVRSTSYMDILKSFVPADWTTFRSDLWIEAKPPSANIPDQGFKLHLSATLEDGDKLLQAVLPILVKTETYFKIIFDISLHKLVNSKRFPRASSGKFVTVYPANEQTFIKLAEEIAGATETFRGPYILSDRRYKSSKVLFYRYGGFKRISEVQLDGTRRLLIRSSDGRLVPDDRVPFFQLPEEIVDPLGDHHDAQEGDGLLAGRYRVEEALNFTATGGVYRAVDIQTSSTVVIKEARPDMVMVAAALSSRDAIQSLWQERRGLELLQGLPCIPRLIDSFVEWEHHFLVQSFMEGMLLASFRAQDDFILMEKMYNSQALIQSCLTWRDIGIRLLTSLNLVHARGVLLGDISPVNVLRNPSTGDLIFIDLESACVADETDDAAVFSAGWAYPGFRTGQRSVRRLTKLDDHYAAGMLLYNLICPIHNIFDLDKTLPRDRFLNHFVENGLPFTMASIIRSLWEGDAEKALSDLHSFSPADCIVGSRRSPLFTSCGQEPVAACNDEFKESLANATKQLAENMLASADFSRDDRLWPADSTVFETNALSVSHGACGVAMFLHELLGTLPEPVVEWILKHQVDVIHYPPGLYTGIAGIASVYVAFGWKEHASAIMRTVPGAPLAFQSPALFNGIAGWGYAALLIFAITQDEELLAIAETAGKYLVKSKQESPQGLYWINDSDAPSKLGMGFGGSGVGLFLLNLWKVTQNNIFLEAARGGLEYDIAHGTERESDGALLYGPFPDGRVHSPYWLKGGGGVTSALIRFYEALGEKYYLDLARRAAIPCADFFSIAPHLYEGLASMGETLLDMYQITGEQSYYDAAVLKAQQALLYKIDQQDGIAFPGRNLLRISHDYGTGGAGIGLFFHRLLSRTPRKFHDILQPIAAVKR